MGAGVDSRPPSTRAFTGMALAVHSIRGEEDAHEYCRAATKTLVIRDGHCGHAHCARRRHARLRDAAPSGNLRTAYAFLGRSWNVGGISNIRRRTDFVRLHGVADGCGIPRRGDGQTRVWLSVHKLRSW